MTADERLVRAIKRGDVHGVRDALSSGKASPNATDSSGHTALSCACDDTSESVGRAMVKDLLEAGADPSLARADAVLPLHLAARADNPDIIEMLLAAAPSTLNRRDCMGTSPLCWASGKGSSRAVSTLLAAGANDQQLAQTTGKSPLAMAVGGACHGVLRILLNEGFAAAGGLFAVPDAMKMAIECGRSRILMTLLAIQGEEEQGYWARVSAQGIPMICWAAGHTSLTATHLLLAAGADEIDIFGGEFPTDFIGSSLPEGVRDSAKVAAVGRMLKRGPAFRARSWAWSALKAAGAGVGGIDSGTPSSGKKPDVALGVRVFRLRKRLFISRIVRYANN